MKTILMIIGLIILITSYSLLNSTLWEIKQDGAGDFTTIAEGINAANSGDTVLVYPGTYYENLEFRGEDIILTSLYGVESNDRRYIRETIIDGGSRYGTVVMFYQDETNDAVLNGFTIQNGVYGIGGGVLIYRSSPTISNCHIQNNYAKDIGGGMDIAYSSAVVRDCIIEHNRASAGGGVDHHSGNAFFAGNTIRHNRALDANGGFRAWGAVLCDVSLNSIYLNYAGHTVNDLSLHDISQQSVVVDTFTVIDPDPRARYLITWHEAVEDGTYDFTALNSKIEPVAADLYVATDGCNSNSGLTPQEPLQTIAFAMSRIKAEGPERKNIFVADGIYSHSLNNQAFPMQVLSNVNIIGESKENTILDLEHSGWAFSALVSYMVATSGPDQRYKSNFSIKNFTIKNGGQSEDFYRHMNSGIRFYSVQDYELENIGFTGSMGYGRGDIFSAYGANFLWKDLNLYDNIGGPGIFFLVCGGGVSDTLSFHLEDIRINSHKHADQVRAGSGMSMYTYVIQSAEKPVAGTMVNLEITDGEIGNIEPFWGDFPYSHFQYNSDIDEHERRLRIVNATIGNNRAVGRRHGGGMLFEGHVEAEIINSIIYGNRPDNLVIHNWRHHQMDIHFINSILEGGIDRIKYYGSGNADIHWHEGSMDIDPLWVSENDFGIYPYMLSGLSPARDAGTLHIPDFEFPEYDLAGNPRVYGGSIDLGAYEWHPPTTNIDEGEVVTERLREGEFKLHNFPNPAVTLENHRTVGVEGHRSSTTGTNIAFELPEAGNVVVEIYNLKGQFVRRVFDAYIPSGEHNVFWDGKDERGRYVATGFYMYHLHFNDQLVATGRATFIK